MKDIQKIVMLFQFCCLFVVLLFRRQKLWKYWNSLLLPYVVLLLVFFAWWNYKREVEDDNYNLPKALVVTQEFKLERGGQEQALHMDACYKENQWTLDKIITSLKYLRTQKKYVLIHLRWIIKWTEILF